MLLRFGLFAILLAAALPIAAQPPGAASPAVLSGPQAAIQRTAIAFSQCVGAGIQNLSASATAEAGAATVLGGCTAQRGELTQAVDAMIATMPEAQRAAAHAQFESQMGLAEAKIADAIRQRRAAPPAAAAPATPAH